MAEDLLAFSADGPWQSWQMAEDLLAMITKLLTCIVNIMQVILCILLTTYSFLPVAILVKF